MFNPFVNSDAVSLRNRGDDSAAALGHDELAGQASTQIDDRTPIKTNRLNEVIGQYQIEAVISSGGMGTVRRARDMRNGHAVAIKTLRRDLLGQTDVMARFRREIRIGNLNHRYIMPVIDDGESENQPFYVMPLARDSLAKLSGLYRTPRAAAAVMAKVARGVGAAHRQKILHRDLKPANILIGLDGEPLVADFGLAKFLDGVDGTTLTMTGALVGTMPYMAPEQAMGSGNEVGPPADVWALGVILYELLTGERPFDGSDRQGIVHRIRQGIPESLRHWNPALDTALSQIVNKCLCKRPIDRYQTADELADDLDAWLEGRPIAAVYQRTWTHRFASKWRRCSRSKLIALGFVAGLIGITIGLSVISGRESQSPVTSSAALLAIQTAMKTGQPMQLIGPRTLPRWHHWELGKNTGRLLVSPGGGTRIESPTLDLMTLVNEPPRSFRLDARLRRVRDGGKNEELGLFAGHRRVNDPIRVYDAYVGAGTHNLVASTQPRMTCGFKLAVVGGVVLQNWHGHEPLLAVGQDDPFDINLIVTPDGFKGSVNGSPVEVVGTKELRSGFNIAKTKRALASNEYTLSPQGACGIYVREAVIDVLHVTITPLEPEN